MQRGKERVVYAIVLAAFLLFLYMPLIIVAGASLTPANQAYVSFPPKSVSLYWYQNIPQAYWNALFLSLRVALGTAVISCVIATPLALGIVRAQFPGKAVLVALLRAPLQIPYVVTGIAFLLFYYALGDALGIHLRATYIGLVLGHTFLATPYVTASIVAVLSRFNSRLEEAAAIHGASPWRTFRRVTLPLIMPGVYGGAVYAFIISFGEVPVALFLGGAGATTLPVEIFSSIQFDFGPALLSISTIVLIVSFVALILIQKIVGLESITRPTKSK